MRPTFDIPKRPQVLTDQGAVQWDVGNSRPIDYLGSGGRILTEELAKNGMSVPDAYVAPQAGPDELRITAFKASSTRAEIVQHLREDSLAQLETYVRSLINADLVNADAATNLATAIASIKRIEAAFKRLETSSVRLAQSVALLIRE